MTEQFKPHIYRGWAFHDMLAGAPKIATDAKPQDDGSVWASFCSTRSVENCKLCLANGQAAEVGCKNPVKP